jgi:NH3-dependent NAD+ synthetase
MIKFDNLIKRLTNKVKMSANPVPGFIVGLSGTDSIVTFILLNEVARTEGFKVFGVHYVDRVPAPNSLFIRETLPWLKEKFSDSSFIQISQTSCENPARAYNGNLDQTRWADLHYRAVEQKYWTVSTVNATEKALGTFGIMSNSASIAPIISLYKSEVLKICEEYGVPSTVIAASRLPDCICGRDEFAAENIELIDELLRYNLTKSYSADLLRNACDYIRDTRRENDFKNRTPYIV